SYNDTTPTATYTLSLHDALPISRRARRTGTLALWGGRRQLSEKSQVRKRREAARRRRRVGLGRAALAAYSLLFRHARKISTFFRSEEHTSELQSRSDLVCRLLLE